MTLDDLVALNDEITALVRAGVPLEAGLAAIGGDMPGRLGRTATAWAESAARGQSIEDAFVEGTGSLPPAYRAIVRAGMRAGRLPAALEAVAASGRRLAETRRAVLLAVSYPIMVFLVAWVGVIFFTRVVAPGLAEMFKSFHIPGYGFMAAATNLGGYAWYWGPAVPIIVLAALAVWWLACTQASAMHGSRANRLIGWLPWVGPMLRWSRTATFLDILALLVEHHTPLDEAVVLAGEASGDAETVKTSQQLALALRQGQMRPSPGGSAFPPMVDWLMLAAGRDGALLPALQHSASSYHQRARHQADMIRVFLPICLTIGVGGTITVLYALALFFPYATMLRSLSVGG